MNKVENDITSYDDYIEQKYGPVGAPKRDAFERGFEEFYLGVLIKEERLKQGLTQEQLAEKIGTTKSYISKVENDVNEIRLSTLRKIIEGLGGHVQVTFNF